MKTLIKAIVVALIAIGSYSADAQEITSPGFGEGILEIETIDSSFYMNFSARFQGLFTSDWNRIDPYQNFAAEKSYMLIRRARLKFSGFAYSPNLEYKLQLGLSNRDLAGVSQFTHNAPRLILDAVLKWSFHENFELWVGQTKLPGNREELISSGNLQFVDRSLLNGSFGLGRDMGVQLHHYFVLGEDFIIKESLAFSQGEGRNVTTGNLGGYQYTGRLEILPFGEFEGKGAYSGGDLARHASPKLSLATTYDFNNDAVRTESNAGLYMFTDDGFHETDVSTFFIDAMFKYRGFSFMAEYAQRRAEDPSASNTDGILTGDVVNVGNAYNFQAGYLFQNDYEISLRYTRINLEKELFYINAERQYTLGVSKYIVGHKLKIQSDLSYNDWKNSTENDITFRLQFEIHF